MHFKQTASLFSVLEDLTDLRKKIKINKVRQRVWGRKRFRVKESGVTAKKVMKIGVLDSLHKFTFSFLKL